METLYGKLKSMEDRLIQPRAQMEEITRTANCNEILASRLLIGLPIEVSLKSFGMIPNDEEISRIMGKDLDELIGNLPSNRRTGVLQAAGLGLFGVISSISASFYLAPLIGSAAATTIAFGGGTAIFSGGFNIIQRSYNRAIKRAEYLDKKIESLGFDQARESS